MEINFKNGVRPERTEWRSRELSLRHRFWGEPLYFDDVDWFTVEYRGDLKPWEVVLFIDYKHIDAVLNLTHPRIAGFANSIREEVPFAVVTWRRGIWFFTVHPINAAAFRIFKEGEQFTEREWVALLYRLRGKIAPAEVLDVLCDERPLLDSRGRNIHVYDPTEGAHA